MAIAQSVAQCTICTSMSRLAGRLVLAVARLPFREGDQQARSINEAEDGRLHSAGGDRQQKAPRSGGAKLRRAIFL